MIEKMLAASAKAHPRAAEERGKSPARVRNASDLTPEGKQEPAKKDYHYFFH